MHEWALPQPLVLVYYTIREWAAMAARGRLLVPLAGPSEAEKDGDVVEDELVHGGKSAVRIIVVVDPTSHVFRTK